MSDREGSLEADVARAAELIAEAGSLDDAELEARLRALGIDEAPLQCLIRETDLPAESLQCISRQCLH